jgi:hypothetical protein
MVWDGLYDLEKCGCTAEDRCMRSHRSRFKNQDPRTK